MLCRVFFPVVVLNGDQCCVCAGSHPYTGVLATSLWCWNSCTRRSLHSNLGPPWSPHQDAQALPGLSHTSCRPLGTRSTASEASCLLQSLQAITPVHIESGWLQSWQTPRTIPPRKMTWFVKITMRTEQKTRLHSYH